MIPHSPWAWAGVVLGLVSPCFLPEWLSSALLLVAGTIWGGWGGLLAASGVVLLERWGRDD